MTGTVPEELNMIAMIEKIGTLYACNLGEKGDQYECNVSFEGA